MPQVSIILPTYNGERYIGKAIESILGQSFEDFELIIVNDCCTDNTLSIINEYIKRDTRIRLIENEYNMKLPTSLNNGFNEAKGEYLTWTSDDNIYEKDAISELHSYLQKNHNVPMVVARMLFIDSFEQVLYEDKAFDMKDLPYHNNVGACFMYRKSVRERIGNYDIGKFLVEDYDYWLRVYFEYGNIGFINKFLYRYRVHGNSLTEKRRKDISINLSKLRKQNLTKILKLLDGRKDLVCRIYFELCNSGQIEEQTRGIFLERIPELEMVVNLEDKDLIIYGAGAIGEKACQKLGKRVVYYADRDSNKIGRAKNGKMILSPEEMLKVKDNYQIVIAVGLEKVYDVLQGLLKQGLEKVAVWQGDVW